MQIDTLFDIGDFVFVDHKDIPKTDQVKIVGINITAELINSKTYIDISYFVQQYVCENLERVYEHNIIKKSGC